MSAHVICTCEECIERRQRTFAALLFIEFTEKCHDPGINPQKFGKLSWRQVLCDLACPCIDELRLQVTTLEGGTEGTVIAQLKDERDRLSLRVAALLSRPASITCPKCGEVLKAV